MFRSPGGWALDGGISPPCAGPTRRVVIAYLLDGFFLPKLEEKRGAQDKGQAGYDEHGKRQCGANLFHENPPEFIILLLNKDILACRLPSRHKTAL